MRVVHIDSSVICIEADSGVSIRMFPETASILCKQLKGVLSAIGHEECAPKTAELAATDSQQPKPEIKPALCEGTYHGSCKGETWCDPSNACFRPA